MSRAGTRRGRRPMDVTAFVTIYLALLFAIPSVYTLRGTGSSLGGLGAPAMIVAFVGLAWWFVATIYPESGLRRGRQPLRVAMFLFVGSILVSFALANRGEFSSDLARLADRGLLLVLAMVGLALLVADGVDSLERLDVLLRRFVLAAGLIGVVGIAEYYLRSNFVATVYDKVPFLSSTRFVNYSYFVENVSATTRRVAGTAIHPIEYGVVLALALPLAAHYAVTDTTNTGWRRWWKLFAIIPAEMLAQSRSGIVALVVAAAILIPAWPQVVRRRIYVYFVPALVAGRLLFPGILGTIRNLFLHFQSDPSYRERTRRYPLIFHYISQHPIFGRGFQTFDARSLFPAGFGTGIDNQYLTSLIETGIVGTVLLLGLFVTAIALVVSARRWATDDHERMLAQAIAASLAGVAVSFATWDVFSYAMATGSIFVLLGCAGALWRLERERAREEGRRPSARARRRAGAATPPAAEAAVPGPGYVVPRPCGPGAGAGRAVRPRARR